MESISKEAATVLANALKDEGSTYQRDARATLNGWLVDESRGVARFEPGARDLIEPFIDRV